MKCRFAIIASLAGLIVAPAAHALTTEELLDVVQERAFDYFWEQANPANGLIKDRSTPGSPASIAAVGFGLTSIAIGVDHGWVTREDAAARVLTTLETFWNGPQGAGSSGTIVRPSVNVISETSGPCRHSSSTTVLPAHLKPW